MIDQFFLAPQGDGNSVQLFTNCPARLTQATLSEMLELTWALWRLIAAYDGSFSFCLAKY